MRVVSGIQPSGRLHLGNYFGAVRQFIALQEQAEQALYFIADLHALTSVREGARLRRQTLDLALDLLALGLNPHKAVLFRQSDVPEIPLLAWILSSVTPVALLERAHAYKDKVARGLAPDAGLFTYPVLMSADILLYEADAVPVGQDQKQHLEFARDIATKFNLAYAPGYDPQDPVARPGLFKLPEPLIVERGAAVPGIDGRKMSKSYGNTIELFAEEAIIEKRFMAIKTDPTPIEAPKPEPHPLLGLLQVLSGDTEYGQHLQSWRAGGVGYAQYKRRLIERFHALFGEARAQRAALQPAAAVEVLRAGAEQARVLAAPVWERVMAATGVGARLGPLLRGPETLLE